MPDIRQMPASFNGKLIYQLTSASALKDTDLFAISTSENLTRKVSVTQIKSYVTNDILQYISDIDSLINDIKQQITEINNHISDVENDISEYRNEFNMALNNLQEYLLQVINNLDTKVNLRITQEVNDLDTRIDIEVNAIDEKINNLSQKISDLEKKMNDMFSSFISWGNTIPTSLTRGKVYLQYF